MRGMIFDANVGSSPRMRGTQMQPVGHIVDSGIIPAHAGNTCGFEFGRVVGGDHPRACGEHSHVTLQSLKLVGSSPRMRRTRRWPCWRRYWLRIIPAHAGNTPPNRSQSTSPRDHPRACGEHVGQVDDAACTGGSSPRMRGTHGLRSKKRQAIGIIPAHAGNTSFPVRSFQPFQDHPRACGEHDREVEHVAAAKGSSPRMRGTLVGSKTPHCPSGDHPRACGEHRRVECCPHLRSGSSPRMRGTQGTCFDAWGIARIIPAHAGNTFGHRTAPTVHGDHPRACGEHHITVQTVMPESGSSPRMRGTRIADDIARVAAGIIPAHAGNTFYPRSVLQVFRDHPRACGEHSCRDRRRTSAAGSSPRMRGTQNVSFLCCSTSGIIPAHAGNTGLGAAKNPNGQDHPRACGEHDGRIRWGMAGLGSSPRMRGTPYRALRSVIECGIIPAHAGNTVLPFSMIVFCRDHPRACGEHPLGSLLHTLRKGSSPRMRGTRSFLFPFRCCLGIIPAHAGNTLSGSAHTVTPEDHPRVCGEHWTGTGSSESVTGSSPRMRGTQRRAGPPR